MGKTNIDCVISDIEELTLISLSVMMVLWLYFPFKFYLLDDALKYLLAKCFDVSYLLKTQYDMKQIYKQYKACTLTVR